MKIYDLIEDVLKKGCKPGGALAAHEFAGVWMNDPQPGENIRTGRDHVGITESSLARRLREMRTLGRVTVERRKGESFVRYALAMREPIQQELVSA